MAKISFVKYEGLGNDFIILDGTKAHLNQDEKVALCDRHRGIGADGVIVVSMAPGEETFAYMQVTNSDGSTPEMCGNGFRCVAQWLWDRGKLPLSRQGSILTDAGVRSFHFDGDNCVVDMGVGKIGQMEGDGVAVSMGNPHLVLEGSVSDEQVAKLGPVLEHHPSFPQRTNVEWVHVENPREIKVKVWERGAGITQACGTGACAAVVAMAQKNKVLYDEPIEVHLPGGTLWVQVDKKTHRVEMKGPARRVFEGTIE